MYCSNPNPYNWLYFSKCQPEQPCHIHGQKEMFSPVSFYSKYGWYITKKRYYVDCIPTKQHAANNLKR